MTKPKEKRRIDVKALAREYTESAIRIQVGLMTNEETPPATRQACAENILNRGWGKPPQTQIMQGDEDGGPLIVQVIRFGSDPDTK